MDYNKKLSKTGTLTLPAALRRELGVDQGERFKIIPKNDGSIELKRIQGECIFCKSDSHLLTYMGRFVCKDCLEKMNTAQERSVIHDQ